MCLIDDAEPLDFCFEKLRTARKPHVCSECDRTIAPKEQYVYTSMKMRDWDDVEVYKCCPQCVEARHWLNRHCGGWVYGNVEADLAEHYNEGCREDNLQRLLIGIRRQWKAFRGDGLLEINKEALGSPRA
jgi:hypothetical protein